MERKRYEVRKITREAPAEVDWERAASLTDFSFPWEETSPPATIFRALWNERRLFFRFDCEDADLVLGEGSDSFEKVIGSDRAEIFLTPTLDLNPYYAFEMDPRGEVLDYLAKFHRQFSFDWECGGMEVKSVIDESGYRVTGSFSMETLRALQILKPGVDEIFAGIYRAEFSHRDDGSVHQGWMSWVDPGISKPDFHVPESFGILELSR